MAVKISKRAATVLGMVGPVCTVGAGMLHSVDADDEGTDDLVADLLEFTGGCTTALLNGSKLPPIPKGLVTLPVEDDEPG